MWLKQKHFISKLIKKIKKSVGRNNFGKITVRHRGGGFKSKEIIIDHFRYLWSVPGIVKSLEKHKLHSYYVASVYYPFGISSYIIAPENLKPGHIVCSGENIEPTIGSCLFLRDIPLNIKIYNIESFPRSGGKYIRSAGNWAKILEKNNKKALILFKNGKKKSISVKCMATIGRVSHIQYKKTLTVYKAGSKRLQGIRPHVRGVVMNPIDHPHGGGKGKKSPKNPNYNFIRKLPKGRKTARKK